MPTVSVCPKCGATTVGDFTNCLRCQAPLLAQAAASATPPTPAPAASSPCPFCGATVPAGNSFCSACGRQVAGAPVAAPAAPPASAPAPPPVYQQPAPMAAPAYYQQPQFANNSGTGGPAPLEVRGWNWGAFFWSWIWGVPNGVWVSLLICMLGIIGSIWLGAKGSEMAWSKRRFESIEQFKSTQRAWATWGWVLFFLNLITVSIIALVFGATIVAAIASGEFDPSTLNF